MNNMKVQKRNGEFEEVYFDKILNRIKITMYWRRV